MRIHASLFLTLLASSASLPANTIVAPGIRPNYTATGADLAGLKVTMLWQFSNGPYLQTMFWRATGPDSGEAPQMDNLSPWAGLPPMLTLSGNSTTAVWVCYPIFADDIVSVTLDGEAAGIYFDRAMPNPGSPGTGPGNDAGALVAGLGFPLGATYSKPVSVGGAAPVGDLYAEMTFTFPGRFGARDFTFTQTVVLATPEPSTFALPAIGMALAGAARARRRRSR